MDFLYFVFILLRFLRFFEFFGGIFILVFMDFFSKLIRLLQNSLQGHYWTPKMGQNSIKGSFFPKGEKSLGRRPKPSAGVRSRPLQWAVSSICIIDDFAECMFYSCQQSCIQGRVREGSAHAACAACLFLIMCQTFQMGFSREYMQMRLQCKTYSHTIQSIQHQLILQNSSMKGNFSPNCLSQSEFREKCN